MGIDYFVKCKDCEHEFTYVTGPGMRSDVVTCSSCGQQVYYTTRDGDLEKKEPRPTICECGGKLDSNKPVCHKCHSHNVEIIEKGFMWD